jgi:mRNA interferase RelE/StbE
MYQIIVHPKVIERDIPALSADIWRNIEKQIQRKLLFSPVSFSKPLTYELKQLRSLRIGDYRVIFDIKDTVITIIAISHRKNCYDIATERVH